ncbi:MAG TPA: hypothetical protein PK222_10650, partial [Bacteroidales bacterium]|nr:hypothetical protein [Bacteroidales bacterium]
MKKVLLSLAILSMCIFTFAAEYTIGTGTSTEYYVPFYGYYEYGWSKIIYTKAEINAAGLNQEGNINGIAFYVNNALTGYNMTNQKVYVRSIPTDRTSYSGTGETGNGYPNNANFTKVYEGSISYTGQKWEELTFTTPFYWDNNSNIEILWENRYGSYYSTYPYFRYTSASNTCVYKYATSFPTGAGTIYSNRPNIKLIIVNEPPNPAVLVYPINNGYAFLNDTLVWQSGGGGPTGYDVYLDTFDGSTLVKDHTEQTTTTYTPTNLQ